jgi:hypothetical protein
MSFATGSPGEWKNPPPVASPAFLPPDNSIAVAASRKTWLYPAVTPIYPRMTAKQAKEEIKAIQKAGAEIRA